MSTQVFIRRKDGRPWPYASTGLLHKLTPSTIFIKDFETGEIIGYSRNIFYAVKPFGVKTTVKKHKRVLK